MKLFYRPDQERGIISTASLLHSWHRVLFILYLHFHFNMSYSILETLRGHHISNICAFIYVFFRTLWSLEKTALVYVIVFELMYCHAKHNLLSILMLNVKVEESCVFFLASNILTHLPPLNVKPKAKNLNDELSQSMHATFNKMVVPFSLILFQIILTLIIAATCFGLHLFRSI